MRLREDAVYIKLATYADVLDAGGHLRAVDSLEAATGDRFSLFRDLSGPRRPELELEGQRHELLGIHVGAGFHQGTRFRLVSPGPSLRSLELNAGLHPCSGVYATQLDARLSAQAVQADPGMVRRLFDDWVAWFEPFSAQAHDVDDDAIQNIDSPRLAMLGYGRAAPAEAEGRPGREAVRGQYRFAMTWLCHVGNDALELLGGPELAELEVEHFAVGRGVTFVLGPSPADADSPEFRRRQQHLRDALGIDDLIARDRRSFAYWKRKQ